MKKDLQSLYALFVVYLKQEKKSSKQTIDSYQSDFNKFCEYLFLNNIPRKLSGMKKQVFLDYMKYLNGKGYKQASIRRKINSLKSFFNYLVLHDYIQKHPMLTVDSPKKEIHPPNPMSEEQVSKILETARDTYGPEGMRDYILVKIIAQAGLNRQEAVDLNFSDVDFENSVIHIASKKGHDRYIPIKSDLSDEIWDYMTSRSPLTTDAMFVSRAGNRIHGTKCQTIFKNILHAAGMDTKKYSLKHLRQSYASSLVARGVRIESVKELLGHQCMSSTSRYADTSFQKLREAAEKLPY